MTPKEKAEELVKKLFEFNHRVKWDFDNNDWIHDYYQAKQCALIAVDEIIEVVDHTPLADRDYEEYLIEYWQEVKQEIEKL